ncbi:MAG: transporter associated domain-containing protein, partial [Enterococcus hirae]|nr:transporter associated domain-containing protein [Enterococcus hirae]
VTIPEFEESTFITLSGFMSNHEKNIKTGTVIQIDSFQFTVLEYNHTHVDYFKIKKQEIAENSIDSNKTE